MPAKASSDFGLYKEKEKENSLKSVKFVLVLIVIVLFLLLVVYSVIQLVSRDFNHQFETTIEKPTPNAEKLVQSESIKREAYNIPPKPFGVTHRGQPPSQFTSTTEKITTLNYPQKYFPHNIQDVIGHPGRYQQSLDNSQELRIRYSSKYKQYVAQNKRSARNFTLDDNDPFYLYKPQDPGDINLLATASLRFAPPIWTNLRTKTPRVYFPAQQYQNTHRKEVLNHFNHPSKPLRVTLNVYPNDNEKKEHKFGLKQFINHRIANLQQRVRFPEPKPKKMVIHVNLYPDDLSRGESKMYRNVLTTTPAT